MVAAVVAGLVYPVYGHWAWSGVDVGSPTGWLGMMGFIDFAGSTVVHSVGGWCALALLFLIGPRSGRFPKDGPPRKIPGANLPIATLGVILLWLGWFGFNGGSTLAMNDQVPIVIANTVFAGAAGMVAALGVGWLSRGRADVDLVLNGSLAGLVAITASAFAVTTVSAVAVGAIGGVVMVVVDNLLVRLRIDDAVGAIPVHLGAGIWGTLAVAVFGEADLLGTGLGFWDQLQAQTTGIAACGLWAFGVTTSSSTPSTASLHSESLRPRMKLASMFRSTAPQLNYSSCSRSWIGSPSLAGWTCECRLSRSRKWDRSLNDTTS